MSPMKNNSGTPQDSAVFVPGERPDRPARADGSAVATAPAGAGPGALQGWADWLLAYRVWLLALAHAGVFAATLWTAFLLRFDFQLPEEAIAILWRNLPWVLGVKLGVFLALGQLHGWWRYVIFSDLVALLRAATLSFLLIISIDHFAVSHHVPRTVLLLDYVLTISVLGGLRSSWRFVREHCWTSLRPVDFRTALLVGADRNSVLLANQIRTHRELKYHVRGFLAINGETIGLRYGNLPVLGRVENAAAIAAAAGATDVFVIAGSLPGERLRKLMDVCRSASLQLKILPSAESRLGGSHRIPLRDIQIDDLLQRDAVELDQRGIAGLLQERTVLVTGAGGSIGSEICRQLLRFRPRTLLLVGRGENRIFAIDRELRELNTATRLKPCIGDITDEQRMRQLFEQDAPQVVFHAAAHKHVPLMEDNVREAVKNNVVGTARLADLAHEFSAEAFVLISTDKAVRPTSVMGATKQLAERYVHALAQESRTRFCAVRFGNVLGSAGSVVPIFQEQIRRGGPITVTDPRMVRYFMTIPEASQLVLQAAAMGQGGEIFVLDMGEPVSILELARDLIRLSGLPEDAIDVTFSGVRPGEKLFEELHLGVEQLLPTAHPSVLSAYPAPYALAEVRAAVARLTDLLDSGDACLREVLLQLIPDYQAGGSPSTRPQLSAQNLPCPT